ncbi:MAG: GNAT family N-acetyltransferase, partial [Anaerolineales bacterium]|nr:GNAT family N-acetyltransferase [Anaerolineales bacterium]
MQFQAQHVFYQQNFKQAEYKLVLRDGVPIGRFYVDYRLDEIRIIDIALLPKYRRLGIGSQLMKMVLAEGQQSELPVKIHVEQNNPALHWYTRLGFQQVEVHGVYILMAWQPGKVEG